MRGGPSAGSRLEAGPAARGSLRWVAADITWALEEILPGTEDETIAQLEPDIRALEGVSFYLDRGISALVATVLEGFDRETLGDQALEYRCRCSRERLLDKLLPLAAREPDSLLGPHGLCEAVCAFCGDRYLFTSGELTISH